jgi:hypothetical protein
MKKIIIACVLITIVGCIPFQPKQNSSSHQAFLAQINANLKGRNTQEEPVAITIEKTIDELKVLKDNVFKFGTLGDFNKTQHNLLINDKPFIDREGEIVRFSSSVTTGEFTYTIDQNINKIIKYNRAGSNNQSVKFATVVNEINGVAIHTVTGEVYKGKSYTLTANGFLVSRAGAIFKYVIAEGDDTFSVMDGFHVAELQKGDVFSTNFVLLEKDEATESSGGFMSSLKSLGSTLGVSNDYGYALANLKTGSVVPINISTGSKSVAVHSNCKSNGYVNKCEEVDMVESLYEKNGRKNHDHYYWGLNWFMGKNGPVAIYKESSVVKYVNLSTKQELPLFSRVLGIAWMNAESNSSGIISVSARVGFSTEEIDDVEAYVEDNKMQLETIDIAEL